MSENKRDVPWADDLNAAWAEAGPVTADTIIDEQIRALLADLREELRWLIANRHLAASVTTVREDARACYAAISTPWKFATPDEALASQRKRDRGRARCAEILNARTGMQRPK